MSSYWEIVTTGLSTFEIAITSSSAPVTVYNQCIKSICKELKNTIISNDMNMWQQGKGNKQK